MTDSTNTPAEGGQPATAAPAAPAESLLHSEAPGGNTQAEQFAFADKVLVKAQDGATDWEQTARKAEQARQHLEKRMGSGDAPPKDVAGYEFKMPEKMEGFELKSERIDGFKAEALKHGISPAQFSWMMDSYLAAVPDLMEGAAKMSANEARTALQGVWAKPEEFTAGLTAAQTATKSLPADLQDAAQAYGTDPTFIRIMAWVGQQMGEDRPPSGAAPAAQQGGDVNALMASAAYRDRNHPDHQKVSQQVAAFFSSRQGAATAL